MGGWLSSYYVHAIFYFLMNENVTHDSPALGGLIEELFTSSDDEFRNSRIKLFPAIVDCNWLVQQSVGNKPCIIGRKLTNNYLQLENYLEIGLDVDSSVLARQITGLALGYASTLTVDIGLAIESLEQEELPEQILACVRITRPGLTTDTEPLS